MTIQNLPIQNVFPNPKQPRTYFNPETLQELATSIKEHGLIEPIIVESVNDQYMIVAGERRWQASKLAGCTTIEAVIRERSNHNGREILLSAVIENVQREDMNPVDEAQAYFELSTTHNMSVQAISIKTGKNTKRVYDLLNVLKLEKEVQDMMRDDSLSHDSRLVNALLSIPKADMQIALAKKAVKENWTIKTSLKAIEKLAEVLGSKKKNEIRKGQNPALYITRRSDEEKKPAKWDALLQVGKVPAWPLVLQSAKTTCADCELRDMASRSTCGRCPLVVMLTGLLESEQ